MDERGRIVYITSGSGCATIGKNEFGMRRGHNIMPHRKASSTTFRRYGLVQTEKKLMEKWFGAAWIG